MNKTLFMIGVLATFSFASTANAQEAQEQSQFITDVMAAHNMARQDVDVEPLRWNARLAAEAQSWANILARRNLMQHSSHDERNGAGENLWAGTSGYFSTQDMINAFVRERADYVHGDFPNVSRTGNWADVGHYTQIVWRDTREVGCAIAEGGSNEFLVCRYSPAGNVVGQRAY